MSRTQERHYYGWLLDVGKVEFERALRWQHTLVKLRREGLARDTIIFVEHPPVITVGKDGHEENYKDLTCQVHHIERGGDVTYHGPGQLVAYFVFDLARRGRDVHEFMVNLQMGIIRAMEEIGIAARFGDEHTGVWVGDKKIASVGVAIKKWISFHGVAINLNTDLEEFRSINPCGLKSEVMTSAVEILNKKVDFRDFKSNLLHKYSEIFDTTFYPIQPEEIAEDIESQSGGNVI